MPQNFKIDRQSPKPIYRQIYEWMRGQITSGLWPEHYRLKSELDLVIQLGVNRGTIRKAIAELVAEGLLVIIHGRGTFVASRTLEQPLANGLIAVSEHLLQMGIPFETRVLEQTTVPASQRIAGLLSVSPETEVFFLKRVRAIRQEPLTLLQNYVRIDHCPQIGDIDFTQHKLLATLEVHYNLPLSWGQRVFQAQVANAEMAELLGILPGDPVMYLEQVTYTRDGTPVEASDVWFRGDRFHLSSIVKRDVMVHATDSIHESVDV